MLYLSFERTFCFVISSRTVPKKKKFREQNRVVVLGTANPRFQGEDAAAVSESRAAASSTTLRTEQPLQIHDAPKNAPSSRDDAWPPHLARMLSHLHEA